MRSVLAVAALSSPASIVARLPDPHPTQVWTTVGGSHCDAKIVTSYPLAGALSEIPEVVAESCSVKCAGDGKAPGCSGYLPEYDGPDSPAVCLAREDCKALCDTIPDCAAVEVTKDQGSTRCYLVPYSCMPYALSGRLLTDSNWDFLYHSSQFNNTDCPLGVGIEVAPFPNNYGTVGSYLQVDETLYEQITVGSPAQIKWHTGGCGWVLQVPVYAPPPPGTDFVCSDNSVMANNAFAAKVALGAEHADDMCAIGHDWRPLDGEGYCGHPLFAGLCRVTCANHLPAEDPCGDFDAAARQYADLIGLPEVKECGDLAGSCDHVVKALCPETCRTARRALLDKRIVHPFRQALRSRSLKAAARRRTSVVRRLVDDATCAENHETNLGDTSEVRCLATYGCCYEPKGDVCKECSGGASGFDGLFFEMYSTSKDPRAICGKPARYNYTIPWTLNRTNASSMPYLVPNEPDLKYLKGPKYDLLSWSTVQGELTESCLDRPHFVTESGTYCPHNNIDEKNIAPLISAEELKDRFHDNMCSFKCIEGQTGPFSVKGFCSGAENLEDATNALCLPRSECEALCSDLGPACSSIDMSSIAPRCWLNGPHCDDENRARESFKNLDYLTKNISRTTSFTYEAEMCVDPLAAFDTMEVNNKTIILDFLFELEAMSTQGCEQACLLEEGCAGFELKYNATGDVHKCYYFNSTGACGMNNTVGPCRECAYRAPSPEITIGLQTHPPPCHVDLVVGEALAAKRFDRVPGVYVTKDHTQRLVFVDASGFDAGKCDGWHVQDNQRSPRQRPFGICQNAPEPVKDHIGLNCTALKPWECSWYAALCVEECVPMKTMKDTVGKTIVARYYNESCEEVLMQEPARAYRKSIFRNETGGPVFDNHTSGCVDLDPTTCDVVLAYLCREVCNNMTYPEEAFGPAIMGTVLDYDHDDFASKFVTYSPQAPSNQTKGSFEPHPEWKFVRDDLSALLDHLPGETACLRLETGYPIVNGSYAHPAVIETELMHHLGKVWLAEPPEIDMDWSGHCLQQPTCPTKSTCIVRDGQLTKELGLLDERGTAMEDRTHEDRVAALQGEAWDDRKPDKQMDPKYGLGLPKILVNSEMTVAALRIEQIKERAWGFNTDLYLSVPGHTRFRVAQVPPETETVLAVVLPGAATAVKKHVRPPQGYAPFVSDFFKVSIFDTESVPIAGEVKVELYVPGNLSAFGIKILHVETKALLMPEAMPGSYPGWMTVVGPPGHYVATHDTDECASSAVPSGCEAHADGGFCLNTEGDYLCGCRDGFRALDGSTFPVPVGVQCFRIAPSMDGAFSYLVYPLEVEGGGFKVKEFTAFPAYSVKTGKCSATVYGNPEDEDASPVSFAETEAAPSFPTKELEYLTDGTPKPWESQCQTCLRTENAGAYVLGTTAQQVECVRIEMSSDCAVPKFLVARGALPGVEKGKSGADGHAGWTVTKLIETGGRPTIDIPMPCGDVDMQYFGETLVEYDNTVGACQCLQLCADHIDEGCEAWKWYRETRRCFLLKSVFPPDERSWVRKTDTELRDPSRPPGWWRKQKPYPGWVSGLAGPLTTALKRVDAADGTFSVEVIGVGFPSGSTATAQRIKILQADGHCVFDVPPEEVSGNQCTNDFACSPGPSFTSMTRVVFDGFTLLQRKLDTKYKVCWCPGDCALGEYWHTVPGFLETPAAALVWTAVSPFTYGALEVTVSRPPFQSYSGSSDWRVRIVRADLSCSSQNPKSICGGLSCGVPVTQGADVAHWTVDVAFDTPAGAYRVCIAEDGVTFHAIPSTASQYIQLNGGPPTASFAPYTQQRFSARVGAALSIKLPGGIVYPTQSKLGVVSGAGCGGDLELILSGGEAFTGDVPWSLAPGEYNLCYCDATLDETLVPSVPAGDPEYPVLPGEESTWKVTRFVEGTPMAVEHPDRCETKCGIGCVGPTCYCGSYLELVAQGRPHMDSALCLPIGECRALCAGLSDCAALTVHTDEPICWLTRDTSANATAPDTNVWIPQPGYACTHDDFAVASNVGKLVVTARPIIAVDYVVTPDTNASLEVTGDDLTPTEKALLIPNFEKCGYGADDRLPPVLEADLETSSDTVASFHGVVLTAGTYTLCFCDPAALPAPVGPPRPPCGRAEDFTVTVGTVHASGLGCLFGAGGATKSCNAMPAGGFRCYDADDFPSPNVTLIGA